MKKENLNITEQKVLPHDLNTEHAVLATLMRYNEKYPLYSDLLSSDLFYQQKEKSIFACIEGVITGGGITDVNSLYNYAKSNEVGFPLEHYDFVEIFDMSNTQTLEQDIRRLRDMAKRRTCWMMLQQASAKVLDMMTNFDDEVNGVIMSMGEVQDDSSNNEVTTYNDALMEVKQGAEDILTGKSEYLKTGFALFDNHYLLRPNTLTIIAAFTSVGKSALAMNIAQAVARQDIPVAYYSLEMSKKELAARGIAKAMDLPSSVILNKKLSETKMRLLYEIIDKNKNLPIFFDDRSTISFERTIRSIRMMVKTKGIKLAIIDYLQIYSQTSDDAEQSLSYMARTLKQIAKETGIPVIALSQLNRSALHPSIKMLRGSGQIEESADNVVLIDRPEAYPDSKVTKYEGEFSDSSIKGTAKLILSKGRGVGTGCSLVAFDGRFTTFYEIEKPDGGQHYEHKDDLPF